MFTFKWWTGFTWISSDHICLIAIDYLKVKAKACGKKQLKIEKKISIEWLNCFQVYKNHNSLNQLNQLKQNIGVNEMISLTMKCFAVLNIFRLQECWSQTVTSSTQIITSSSGLLHCNQTYFLQFHLRPLNYYVVH